MSVELAGEVTIERLEFTFYLLLVTIAGLTVATWTLLNKHMDRIAKLERDNAALKRQVKTLMDQNYRPKI